MPPVNSTIRRIAQNHSVAAAHPAAKPFLSEAEILATLPGIKNPCEVCGCSILAIRHTGEIHCESCRPISEKSIAMRAIIVVTRGGGLVARRLEVERAMAAVEEQLAKQRGGANVFRDDDGQVWVRSIGKDGREGWDLHGVPRYKQWWLWTTMEEMGFAETP